MIYCVEDDISIRDLMIYTLKMAGFEAKGFSEAKSFYSALEEAPPELVILDIMLPGEDGISVLRRLRADSRFSSLPVIMATAKNSEYDKVVGLDLGADDYLSKPFGMLEMVSRIKAVLRRSAAKRPAGKVLGIADIRIDTDKHTVTVSGREIALTLKEYDLLKLFLENPGRVCSCGNSFFPPSGVPILSARPARWTFISVLCAPSSALPEITFARCAVSGIK